MNIPFEKFIIPLSISFVSFLVLMILRTVVFKMLHKWAKRSKTRLDNMIIDSLRTPSIYWCIAIAVYTGIALSELSVRYVHYASTLIHAIIILSITIATANLAGRLLTDYVQSSNLPIPTTGLFYGIVKGTILVIGILITLTVIGISITPIITTLGVGGLAVALALQDTLANLFAGIHILVEKSVRIGDFVKLEGGQEGFVEDITWRTTRIRMLPNNMVIIPNSTLAKSVVTNYYLPEKRMSLLIAVSVSVDYGSDPYHIEEVLIDEAKRAVGEIPGLLGDPEPFVRFIPGFGESSLDFTLICQVGEFTDQYLAQHELRKRIFKRFREEGISIPFPHRTVYIREEKDWNK
jgi:small-conductance mechanosensitive channel